MELLGHTFNAEKGHKLYQQPNNELHFIIYDFVLAVLLQIQC
jgi:hypothetical protein